MADVKEFDLMVSDDEMDIDPEATAAIEEGIREVFEPPTRAGSIVARKLESSSKIGVSA
jgi:hypothetical protein